MLFLLLVLPPALFAAANLIDKFLVDGDGEDSNPGPLIAIGGLFNLLAAIILGLVIIFFSTIPSVGVLLPLVANGATYLGAFWLYFHVLREEEASRVTPWLLSIPMFGIGLAYLALGESPVWYQAVAIVVLMASGFFLSIKNGVVKRKMMVMMLASAGLLAVNDVVFARFGRELNWSQALFADVLGKAVWGLAFLVVPINWRGFKTGLRTKLRLQATGEIITIIADGLFDIAKIFIPIAIVQATCCTQPLFVLFGALLLAKLYPKVLAEELKGKLWLKAVVIVVMVVAGAVLATTTV